MEENTKVSVIIIIYKVERYLEQCLESVIRQSHKNIEIICVAAKGDEKCEKICREFAAGDERIKLLVNEPEGTAVARNQGLDASTGDYIAFVDGDDYIEADTIECMLDAAKRHDADISVVGKYYTYMNCMDTGDATGDREQVYKVRDAIGTVFKNDRFFLHLWDKLYKRSLFDGLRFARGQQVEDRQMTYRLLLKSSKIVYTQDPKYHFRVSLDSGSRVADNLRLSLEEDKLIVKDALYRFPDLKEEAAYFMMVENMSVIQNSILFDTYSKEHDREYLDYVKDHYSGFKANPFASKALITKAWLCIYSPFLLKLITKGRRRKFSAGHIPFKTGAEWEFK